MVIDGQPFEVTTLREDIETFGRKAKVAFGRDWTRDAMRRDFTMNGLFATADGVVHDEVGGLADIDARRVRFIGDPAQRIAEDYLRILRFFRIHAAYGEGAPDAAGYEACIAGRDGLTGLSAERIRMEMLKLMIAKGAAEALVAMDDAGLLLRLTAGVVYHGAFANMLAAEHALASTGRNPPPRCTGGCGYRRRKASVTALAAVECRSKTARFHGASLVAHVRHG
jgi:poly(A) polymerase/tRNA nucleotidyltransferase (CCA-adding enzyme)